MEKEFNFTFNESEANIMLNALSTQPFAQVAKLIQKLQEQAQNQMQPAPAPEAK